MYKQKLIELLKEVPEIKKDLEEIKNGTLVVANYKVGCVYEMEFPLYYRVDKRTNNIFTLIIDSKENNKEILDELGITEYIDNSVNEFYFNINNIEIKDNNEFLSDILNVEYYKDEEILEYFNEMLSHGEMGIGDGEIGYTLESMKDSKLYKEFILPYKKSIDVSYIVNSTIEQHFKYFGVIGNPLEERHLRMYDSNIGFIYGGYIVDNSYGTNTEICKLDNTKSFDNQSEEVYEKIFNYFKRKYK